MFKFFRHSSTGLVDAYDSRPVLHSLPARISTSARPHADIQMDRYQVPLLIVIDGNLLEKSLLRAAIDTATCRATAL